MVAIRADESKVYPRYLFAVLRSPETRRRIEDMHVGTLIPHFKKGDFDKLYLPIPARPAQMFIGDLYFELSARIDLLRRTNGTLEAIAQALFKSWFIDFDPVRAKAEGREPEGMDAATAALFPSEFEESELGKIPKGWRVGCLGDILIQRVERAKPSMLTAGLPYVPIECISPKSVFLCESLPGEQAQSSLTFFKKDDVLFGAMRPYFHKVCIAPFDGVTRTTAFVLQAKKGHRAFALFAAFDDSTVEFATTHSEGSTIPYAKWTSSLERKRTIIPPATIAAQFESLVTPLLESGMHNTTRSSLLTDLRDTLLPRLISGKLRITEAMEQVEEALT
jgi:type I restriction enzyme S subunit